MSSLQQPYKVVLVSYEEDGCTVKDILNEFETDDLFQAFNIFNTSDNALFFEMIDGHQKLTNKKSKTFRTQSVKQYYLDITADMMNQPHVSYDELLKRGYISQKTNDSFDVLIFQAFLRGGGDEMKSPRIRKPMIDKMMEILYDWSFTDNRKAVLW